MYAGMYACMCGCMYKYTDTGSALKRVHMHYIAMYATYHIRFHPAYGRRLFEMMSACLGRYIYMCVCVCVNATYIMYMGGDS